MEEELNTTKRSPGRLRRIFKIAGTLFLGLLIGTILTVWLFRKAILESQLSKLLNTPVEVQSASFDLTDFPLIQIYMEDVTVKARFGETPLMTTKFAEMDIDLHNLYFDDKKKEVNRIVIRQNVINMVLEKDFRRNFQVFQPYDPSRKRPDEVYIRHLMFMDTRLDYRVKPYNRHYSLHIDSSDVEMKNYRGNIIFNGKVKGHSRFLELGGFKIMANQPFSLDTELELTKDNKLMDFHRMNIELVKSKLSLTGRLLMNKDRLYDIKFNTTKADVPTLLTFLPEKAKKTLKNYKLDGELSLSGSIVGRDDEANNPSIQLKFRATNTSILHKQTGVGLNQLMLNGILTNGEKNTIESSSLQIDSLVAMFEGRPLRAQLKLSRFNDLFVEGKLDAAFAVKELISFVGKDSLLKGRGVVHAKIDMAGAVKHIGFSTTSQYVRYNGYVELRDVGLNMRSQPVEVMGATGKLELIGRDLVVEDLRSYVNAQPLSITAKATDFLGYLYAQNKQLNISASLVVDTLHIPKLLDKIDALRRSYKINKEKDLDISMLGADLPKFLNVELNVSSPLVYLNKYAYNALYAKLILKDGSFELKDGNLGDFLKMGLEIKSGKTKNDYKANISLTATNLIPHLLDFVNVDPSANLGASGQILINGFVERKKKPKLAFDVKIRDGEVENELRDIHLDKFTLNAHFDEQHFLHPKTTSIRIDSIYGIANFFPFWAEIRINNPVERMTVIDFRTTIGADVFLKYFTIPEIQKPRGKLEFEVQLAGRLDEMAERDKLVQMPQSGNFTISNGGFRLAPSGLPFRGVYAAMHYDGNGVQINYMNGEMNDDQFYIKGQMKEILRYLYTPNAPLIADITYVGDSLDVELFALLGSTGGKKKRTLKVPTNANLSAKIFVDHAYYQHFTMKRLDLEVTLNEHLIQIPYASLYTCDGRMQLQGTLNNGNPQLPMFSTWMKLDNVDVHEFFASFDALDQQKLQDLGIYGRLSMEGKLKQTLSISNKRLFLPALAKFNIAIRDGKIEDLSKFVKPSPLLKKKDLLTPTYFTLLLDSTSFKDSTIVTPNVEFISNKVSFNANGFYDLKNQFHYDVAVLKTRNNELDAEGFYETRKYYGKTFYLFTVEDSEKEDKVVKVKLRLGDAIRNIFRSKKNDPNYRE